MKRILVIENSTKGTNSPRKSLREGNRLAADLNTKICSPRKPLREEERSTIDIQALQKVQEQFDGLIKEMMTAKVLLAGLEIGGDDAYYEEYEKEASETGEME
jgi:hypothetical protein